MSDHRNLIPKIGLVIVVTFFAYGWAVVGSSKAGSLIETLGVFGTILLYAAIIATFATMFIAARRAHLAGSWVWFLAVIFIWPLSYLYTLGVNRHGRAA
ncbi:MAG: hypothetical protein J0L89_07140 [Xanthomonadales bacterium]|nr:hypothetical protein [Xanthomonadales bacterium]